MHTRLAVALTTTALLLAACSSSDTPAPDPGPTVTSPSSPSPSSSPSAMPAPSSTPGALVGGDPSTWAPLELTKAMSGQVITMVTNQQGIIGYAGPRYQITSSNPEAVTVTPARDATENDGYASNAGVSADTTGAARITVTAPNGKTHWYIIQVTSSTDTDAPAAQSPQIISEDTTLTLSPGQTAVIPNTTGDATSSNDNVATAISSDTTTLIVAVGTGNATVTTPTSSGNVTVTVTVTP